jgi:hypothetical protein
VTARPVAASLRSVSDFLIQVTGLTAELAQSRFVELKENLAQFFRFRITGCEALSVNLTQPADEGISVRMAREADIAQMRRYVSKSANAEHGLKNFRSLRTILIRINMLFVTND